MKEPGVTAKAITDPEHGGTAFPVPSPGSLEPGMSLRDYFAAKALQGLWANSESIAGDFKLDAQACYEMADAMLRAREPKP